MLSAHYPPPLSLGWFGRLGQRGQQPKTKRTAWWRPGQAHVTMSKLATAILAVEYSSTANTHPEGVRLVVLKTPPE